MAAAFPDTPCFTETVKQKPSGQVLVLNEKETKREKELGKRYRFSADYEATLFLEKRDHVAALKQGETLFSVLASFAAGETKIEPKEDQVTAFFTVRGIGWIQKEEEDGIMEREKILVTVSQRKDG